MMSLQKHSFSFNQVRLAPAEQIDTHRQSSWELSYVVIGSGVRLIGDTAEAFQCGEVVMIPPEIPHGWLFNKDDTDSKGHIFNITITFTDEFLDHCSSVFPELRIYVERLKTIREAVKYDKQRANPIISILKSMREQDDVERLASMIRLLAIVSITDDTQKMGKYKKTDKKQERLNRIRTYVICNASRDISLDDVVRHVGMNRSAFCVFFKQCMGKTFITYLNEYRIELACQLLKQKNMSVSEICYHVGFTNIPYFNRTFKRMKGCSPTQYSASFSPINPQPF